jgi:GcrA cell cycle regulator
MDWTPDQIGQLTRLWSEGLSTAEIGKRLGISKNAVVGKAHRLHLNSRPSPIKRVGPRPAVVRQPHVRPAAAPAVASSAPAPQPTPVRVVELSSQACRWPIGHPGEENFHFCTSRAIQGKPYCVEHSAVAYVKAKPKAGEAA